MTVIRSRRAGISAEEAAARPLYAKVLGLQYLRPGSLLSFIFFEGSIALGVLLALAELAEWWIVAVLPVSIAAMVKLNDVIAGAAVRSGSDRVPRARGRARVRWRPQSALDDVRPTGPTADDPPIDSPEQRARQSGSRRYS